MIFGSCYTYYSIVKSIMTAYGLFSALAVAAEKGQCTDGLSFEFDDQQKNLLTRFVQVLSKMKFILINNVFIYG